MYDIVEFIKQTNIGYAEYFLNKVYGIWFKRVVVENSLLIYIDLRNTKGYYNSECEFVILDKELNYVVKGDNRYYVYCIEDNWYMGYYDKLDMEVEIDVSNLKKDEVYYLK